MPFYDAEDRLHLESLHFPVDEIPPSIESQSHLIALVGNLNVQFYLSFMLYCKLQGYNHTNIYVFKCVYVKR